LAQRYDEITGAGGRIVGISIDSPQQNAAMIEKLMLPFPLLSDPDREGAISPYRVADENDARDIARPAAVVVAPDGEETFRLLARDFADRPVEDEIIAELAALGLPPASADPLTVGPAEPGPKALVLETLLPYYRGAFFAVKAMGLRHPDLAAEADTFMAQLERYSEGVRAVYKAGQNPAP
jgi:hypothetical protein